MENLQVTVTHSNNHVMGVELPNTSAFDESCLHVISNKVSALNICINERRSLVST